MGKYSSGNVISVIYLDAEARYYYVKRFEIEENEGKLIRFIGENPENKLVSITWMRYPRFELEFTGKNSERENEIIEVAKFIGVKSWKAKGKRLSSLEVGNIKELEPVMKDEYDKPEPDMQKEEVLDVDDIPFEIKRTNKEDEDLNQMTLF
jgi:topoisomerase-4 subunit A